MGLSFQFQLSQYNHICHSIVSIQQHAVWVYLSYQIIGYQWCEKHHVIDFFMISNHLL